MPPRIAPRLPPSRIPAEPASRSNGDYSAQPRSGALGWLYALFLLVRIVLIAVPILALFICVSSLASAFVEDERARWAIGALASLGVPVLLRFYLASTLRRRGLGLAASLLPFIAFVDLLAATALCLGFADDMGRSLRRHGDWFVGERHGLVARVYRSSLSLAVAHLERFDPPQEVVAILLPPDPAKLPVGPVRPGDLPLPPPPPTTIAWFHPLAGAARAMPNSESRRFGAARPQPRPRECELGHCGVDLGHAIGEPVVAVFDGIVERIERDESRGERAGRYVRIGHKDGRVVSRYIHLDTIRADLKEGDSIHGGELIGRLGRSGVINSGPHLHFALSLRRNGRGGDETYVDPEPLLASWQLVSPAGIPGAGASGELAAAEH